MNKHIKQVITGKSRIKRIQELENRIVLGCILESDKLIENYVLKKKTCEFMSYYCK